MTTDSPGPTTERPEDEPDIPGEQPADPFEPEAPAHIDPDTEDIVHSGDVDPETLVVDDQPGGSSAPPR